MARNQKLTSLTQGRTVKSIQSQDGKLLIDFDDGSTMTVKASGPPSSAATGGTVQAVRQQGTKLNLDMEDGSSLNIQTPIAAFYLDAGWGTWGFKATPVCGKTMAYTLARDTPHDLIRPFCLSRYAEYALVGEKGAASVGH